MKPSRLNHWLLAAIAAASLASCDMMKEDLDDCPTGLYVNFVYDYNMQRADMFKDHAGEVQVYVYDEADQLVATKSSSALTRYGAYIHFSEQELAPGHTYRLVALAMQRPYVEALAQPGYKYRISGNTIGSARSALAIALDHEQKGAAASRPAVLPLQTRATLNGAPLDTLWHTLTTIVNDPAEQPLQLMPAMLTPAKTSYTWKRDGSIEQNGVETVTLEAGAPAYATLSLIRDTKQLHVTLRALNDDPADNQVVAEDYSVEIIDNNTLLNYQNDLVTTTADTAVYRPYYQTTTQFLSADGEVMEQAANYDLMFNRLVYKNANVNDDKYAIASADDIAKQRNATLLIRKVENDSLVFGMNLPYILSSARNYQESYIHYQEYLDREYDYRLQFILKGGRIEEIQYFIGAEVHIIPWAVRTQHEVLE